MKAALADRCTLERELGRGGMATVYLAHDLRHDRSVALKVLHPDLTAALGPERFQREIRYAARCVEPLSIARQEPTMTARGRPTSFAPRRFCSRLSLLAGTLARSTNSLATARLCRGKPTGPAFDFGRPPV